MYVCRIHARTHVLPHLILFIHSIAINRSPTDSHRPPVLLGLESRVSGRGFDLGLSLNSNSNSKSKSSFNLSSSSSLSSTSSSSSCSFVRSFVGGRRRRFTDRPTDEVILILILILTSFRTLCSFNSLHLSSLPMDSNSKDRFIAVHPSIYLSIYFYRLISSISVVYPS